MFKVDRAEAICVAEDGDLGVVLDESDKLIRASRNGQVNISIES